jgi:hypothetical protein
MTKDVRDFPSGPPQTVDHFLAVGHGHFHPDTSPFINMFDPIIQR